MAERQAHEASGQPREQVRVGVAGRRQRAGEDAHERQLLPGHGGAWSNRSAALSVSASRAAATSAIAAAGKSSRGTLTPNASRPSPRTWSALGIHPTERRAHDLEAVELRLLLEKIRCGGARPRRARRRALLAVQPRTLDGLAAQAIPERVVRAPWRFGQDLQSPSAQVGQRGAVGRARLRGGAGAQVQLGELESLGRVGHRADGEVELVGDRERWQRGARAGGGEEPTIRKWVR